MVSGWRLVYLGEVDPFEMASYREVFRRAREQDLIPDSLIALRLSKPTAMLGEKAFSGRWINKKFCEENDVTIIRGYGPGNISNYFGPKQILCWIVHKEAEDSKRWEMLGIKKCIVHALQILGLDSTSEGTRNDVLMRGKKVSSIGMYGVFGDVWIYSIDIFMNFNFEIAEKAIVSKHKVPMHETMTEIRVEAGRDISFEEMIDALKDAIEEEYNIEFDISDRLTDAEEALIESLREKYTSNLWLRLGKWSPVKDYWRPK